jgi:hypothetical protein
MNREEGAAHDAGDCLVGCTHPDHAWDGWDFDPGLLDDILIVGNEAYLLVEAADEQEPIFL